MRGSNENEHVGKSHSRNVNVTLYITCLPDFDQLSAPFDCAVPSPWMCRLVRPLFVVTRSLKYALPKMVDREQ